MECWGAVFRRWLWNRHRTVRGGEVSSDCSSEGVHYSKQDWAQSKQASMHSTRVDSSTTAWLGLVWTIC